MTAPQQFGLARVGSALGLQYNTQQQQQQLKKIKSAPELSEMISSSISGHATSGRRGPHRYDAAAAAEQSWGAGASRLPLVPRTEGIELQVGLN
jgi:hypothetical protein